MYLSRIVLDTKKNKTAIALSTRSIFHQALEQAFEGGRQHPIWRIDETETNMSILMVSHDIPYLGTFQEQFGDSKFMPVTKDYDDFLNKLKAEDHLRFKITANPVKMIKGNRVPYVVNGAQKYGSVQDWMIAQLVKHGISVDDIYIMHHSNIMFRNKEQVVTFLECTFEGTGKVTDADAFRDALSSGIGHEKAFGCGLITAALI